MRHAGAHREVRSDDQVHPEHGLPEHPGPRAVPCDPSAVARGALHEDVHAGGAVLRGHGRGQCGAALSRTNTSLSDMEYSWVNYVVVVSTLVEKRIMRYTRLFVRTGTPNGRSGQRLCELRTSRMSAFETGII